MSVRTCVVVIESRVGPAGAEAVLHGVPATQHCTKTGEDLCDQHAAQYAAVKAVLVPIAAAAASGGGQGGNSQGGNQQ